MTCGFESSIKIYSEIFPRNAKDSFSLSHKPVCPQAVICLVALNSSGFDEAKIAASTWLSNEKALLAEVTAIFVETDPYVIVNKSEAFWLTVPDETEPVDAEMLNLRYCKKLMLN